jgi:hypothetical protein
MLDEDAARWNPLRQPLLASNHRAHDDQSRTPIVGHEPDLKERFNAITNAKVHGRGSTAHRGA